ncbi:MAG: hypothetical protein PHR79_06575 [Bacteroidales bacterium]|nr:hypothetical protein [Bacteroidales bacterium]
MKNNSGTLAYFFFGKRQAALNYFQLKKKLPSVCDGVGLLGFSLYTECYYWTVSGLAMVAKN